MILTIENLTKTYGEKTLFSGISLNINEGDKIGVVGVNGTGKSTFLRAVAEKTSVDAGVLTPMRGLRISFLEQEKVFEPGKSVLMEVFRGGTPLMEAIRGYELALQATEKDPSDEKAQKELLSCTSRIDALNGWQLESTAKSILTRLGITAFEAEAASLSGGQQKRVALATALIQPCDLLILDEPTNHLDSDTIAWLEEYLASWRGALLMVTHDRYFLDHTATKIFELDKGKSYTYEGNYSEFLEQKAARIEREEASEKKRQNFLRNELKWIRRGAQARSTKQKARIERYESVKAQNPDLDRGQVEIGLAGRRLGKTVIEMENVGYELDGYTYITDFTHIFQKHERVGILGPNGVGKTTLLDIIAGRLEPTSGKVTIGQTVKIGYFTQTNAELDGRLRAIEYIQEAAHYITLADGTRLSASQLMERFLFPGTLQWTPIERLSGGEKRRLYLLRILMESPNVLLLDEPTNDLVLETMAVLEDFIDKFQGLVVFVSHDRFFVDRIATRVFVYEDGGRLHPYIGGYSDYREQWEMEHPAPESPAKTVKSAAAEKKEEAPKVKKKLTMAEQMEYNEIEGKIAEKEAEVKAIECAMAECASNYGKLNELTKEQQRASEELEVLMDRWAYLEEYAEN